MEKKICLVSTIVNNKYVDDFINQVFEISSRHNILSILSTCQLDIIRKVSSTRRNYDNAKVVTILYSRKMPDWYKKPDRVWDIVYGRNLARKRAIELRCDYVFYIDSDVFVELDLPIRMFNLMDRLKLNVLFHLVPFENHVALFSSALFMVDNYALKKLFFGCYQDIVDENNVVVEDDILMFKIGVLNLRVATCSLSDVKHKNLIHKKRNELIFLDPTVKIISKARIK